MADRTFDTVLDWLETLEWNDLPERSRQAALHTCGNSVGLGVAGTNTDTVCRIFSMLAGQRALQGSVPVLGQTFGLAPVWSCLVHGTAMHVEDFDDTHLATVLHPGAPIAPVALAAAHSHGRSGKDFVVAVAAGVEIACRVGLSLGQEHFNRGWHLTSTVGRVGGAVAGSMLAGLSRDDTRRVVGMALRSFAGHTEQLGSMTKPLHPGKAAADIMRFIELVAKGQLGHIDPRIVQAPLGSEFAGTLSWAAVTDELGQSWEINANAFKPYACGIVSHPIIDVGRMLKSERIAARDIASVAIRVHPAVPAVMGVKNPQDGTQAKFSAYHCFAAGLLEGDGGLSEFSTELARRADSVAVRNKVSLVIDPDMPKQSCHADIVLTDGTRKSVTVTDATGSAANPMTTSDLKRKFLGLTEPFLQNAADAWDLILSLPDQADLSPLFALASGKDALRPPRSAV